MNRKHEITDKEFKSLIEAGHKWMRNKELHKWYESEVAEAIVDMAMKDHPYPTPKLTRYYMVTINFKEGIILDDALRMWRKWKSKKWIKTTYSCIEVRTKRDGVHIHSEVTTKKRKPKCEIIRETYSTFKHLVGSKYAIDVRINLHGFKRYISGYRKGELKTCMTDTYAFRKSNKLPDILEETLI